MIPFLLLGLFTTQVLNFLKSKQLLLKYTVKAGGIILIIIGVMTFTGWMNNISAYLNSYSYNQQSSSQEISDKTGESESKNSSETSSPDNNEFPAFDFTLTDQNGNEHTLSDYKGKVVFLNFWATWCPPCKKEMPDIEALYNEYNLNQNEVVFLGIANPRSEEYPNNQDGEKEEIKTFLHDNGYTFSTLFDETGEVLQNYNISAFPTTFMIDKKGNIFGYVPGMMTKDIMVNIINQTLQSTK